MLKFVDSPSESIGPYLEYIRPGGSCRKHVHSNCDEHCVERFESGMEDSFRVDDYGFCACCAG